MKSVIILLLLLAQSGLEAQNIYLDTLAALPMRTSNNAVVEGFDDGKAYVYSFGGIDETKIYSGIHLRSFRLDVAANEWEELEPLPDTRGKVASSASRVEDIIYIIGGYHVAANGSEVSSAKVHRFDIKSNSFLSDGADIPIAIDDQTQVVKDHLIYVITGWSDNRNIPQVQVYNTIDDSWSMANNLPNSDSYKVFGSAGTIIGDTIYYYGGAGGPGFRPSRELRKGVIAVDNPLEISWTLITPAESETTYRPAASSYNGQPYFFGGSQESYNFNGIAYNGSGGVNPNELITAYAEDSQSLQSFSVPGLPMDLRSVAELSDNEKVIVGGMGPDQTVLSQVLRVRIEGPSNTKETSFKQTKLYPNPVDDMLSLESEVVISKIEIRDLQGQVHFRNRIGARHASLELSELNSKVYFLVVYHQDNSLHAITFIKS